MTRYAFTCLRTMKTNLLPLSLYHLKKGSSSYRVKKERRVGDVPPPFRTNLKKIDFKVKKVWIGYRMSLHSGDFAEEEDRLFRRFMTANPPRPRQKRA